MWMSIIRKAIIQRHGSASAKYRASLHGRTITFLKVLSVLGCYLQVPSRYCEGMNTLMEILLDN